MGTNLNPRPVLLEKPGLPRRPVAGGAGSSPRMRSMQEVSVPAVSEAGGRLLRSKHPRRTSSPHLFLPTQAGPCSQGGAHITGSPRL